jgi:hypothetical protein
LFAHQAFAEGRRSRLSFAFKFFGLFRVVVVVLVILVGVFAHQTFAKGRRSRLSFARWLGVIVVRVVIVAGLFGVVHVASGGWGALVGGIVVVGFNDLVGVIVIGVPKTK